ncbi:fibrous sheath CABYR-binding protein-like [Notolabrus celidotus]|uniref:fibrous sheath CABYR-binding protein-like n=1 Tax=Notolabrus celidotus TaxID=1203425 RepID=UPI00149050C9|nr:fibrous sheath CABYR-binding protein-like [Notolabrus celidotus]
MALSIIESTPELLSAVQILAGSTIEIAAASAGDTSLVEAVQIEAKEVIAEAAAVREEDLESVAETEAPAEEKIAEETSAPIAPGEEEAASPDEPTNLALIENVEEAGAEDQALIPEVAPEDEASSTEAPEDVAPAVTADPVEAVSFTDISPEDSAPAEEATTTAEAGPEETESSMEATPEDAAFSEEATPDEEASSDASVDETPPAAGSVEEAGAEAASEEAVDAVEIFGEAAEVVKTVQLAAASSGSDLEILSDAEPESSSEAPVHEAKHCHSCHSAPSLAEEVAPPAAFGGLLSDEGAEDLMHEAKDAVSLGEGQTTETMVMVTAQ